MPKFKVWWPDYDQDRESAKIVNAVDHEHAAKVWADWYDVHSGDYPIVGGEIATLRVLKESKESITEEIPVTVTVRGYNTRAYSTIAA